MKQTAVFLAVILALTLYGAARQTGSDAAKLVPVQALLIDVDKGSITIRCDTADEGRGESLQAAFSDLAAGCAGKIFTQTAEHVILTQRAWYLMPQVIITAQLRPAAKLYLARGQIENIANAAAFLQAHPGDLTLSQARAALLENRAPQTPVLLLTEGGLRLGQ